VSRSNQSHQVRRRWQSAPAPWEEPPSKVLTDLGITVALLEIRPPWLNPRKGDFKIARPSPYQIRTPRLRKPHARTLLRTSNNGGLLQRTRRILGHPKGEPLIPYKRLTRIPSRPWFRIRPTSRPATTIITVEICASFRFFARYGFQPLLSTDGLGMDLARHPTTKSPPTRQVRMFFKSIFKAAVTKPKEEEGHPRGAPTEKNFLPAPFRPPRFTKVLIPPESPAEAKYPASPSRMAHVDEASQWTRRPGHLLFTTAAIVDAACPEPPSHSRQPGHEIFPPAQWEDGKKLDASLHRRHGRDKLIRPTALGKVTAGS